METNNYNGNGYLASVKAGYTTVWSVTAMNARGQVTAAQYGSSLLADFGYDAYGLPVHTNVRVGPYSLQDYRYSFNAATGNLNWRKNQLKNLNETFTYDILDRMKTVTGPENLTMTYAGNGNILTKSDVSPDNFTYGNNASPYALTGLSNTRGVIPPATQTATYTSFEQVSTIDQNDYHATFSYNSDNQRCKMEVTQQASAILTRWYVGSRYIKETAGSTTKEYTWIGGDAYTAPAVAVKQGSSIQYFYLLRDYLGNITHVVNSSNTVVAEFSFDAWGRRRNATNWSYTLDNEPDLFAGRGFTGHEYLPWFMIYNMNGRLYDPVVGRFLSPDENVQMPDFTQNFNRYSYALNNPLKYSDPDGEYIFTAFLGPVGAIMDAACWGAVLGGAGYTASIGFSDGGFNNWNWGHFCRSVGVGAISGAVTGGIGQIFGPVGSMGFGGEIARAYTHGFTNGMISEFSGGDFITGFTAGSLGSIAGSSFMTYGGKFASSTFGTYAFSGLAGGAGAGFTGGKFREGAAIGIMNAGLNHLQSVLGEAGARYYANKKAGYRDMWDNSFSNGKPIREVSAWELENGDMIMLPYDKNGLKISYNDALDIVKINGKRYVQFNGRNYALATHAHTHPSMADSNDNPLGLSQADLNMQRWIGKPIHILYNKGIYSVDGTYNYKTKVWNYKYIGTW